ncbi:hypothetical protein [Candidatus Contubernalis alkaliaceticus]|uniref:hypothetical protein n=1 Tax=Candidatus Contubernalis alkaliaceticus TaxID=338645 RepID=UPI001F4BDAC2|nr:hypothetical protein [Candidatus Contubernalis alkalaceticus]UNC92715.1 hypothetical protein HUE98_11780 [Candidatus Contubernalis alkalaceticus]
MINDFLNEDCEIIPTARDSYGKYIESTPIPTKCRAKEDIKQVKNKAGIEKVSEIEFWFNPDLDIELDYLINHKSKKHTIINIKSKKDLNGDVIYKVVFV